MDHARDLLHMINQFRAEMPMPIAAVGHSLGANIMVNLAFIHPRLLSTVVLLDPVIQKHASSAEGPNVAQQSTFRRDLWPSRADAEAAFRKQKFYQSWDPRVLDRWCKYGLRETPTILYPNNPGAVTLTTTKHQECLTFLRPSWLAMNEDGSKIIHREIVPDMHPNSLVRYPFYRPEPPNTLARLGELRPSALYIFGETSAMSFPEARQEKLEATGIGLGGSGGVKEGRVAGVVLKGVGHLVAMEASERCADAIAPWIGKEMRRFHAEKKQYLEWTKKSLIDKSTLSQEWEKRIGGPLRSSKGKL
jgi:pimeloyl-ACP methyl ester carboxylesterase